MKSILSVFILILFASCHGFRSSGSASSGQDRGVKQVIVASYRADCFALTAQSCYLIKQNQEDEWKFYYNELAGFDYEEGYETAFLSTSSYRSRLTVRPYTIDGFFEFGDYLNDNYINKHFNMTLNHLVVNFILHFN